MFVCLIFVLFSVFCLFSLFLGFFSYIFALCLFYITISFTCDWNRNNYLLYMHNVHNWIFSLTWRIVSAKQVSRNLKCLPFFILFKFWHRYLLIFTDIDTSVVVRNCSTVRNNWVHLTDVSEVRVAHLLVVYVVFCLSPFFLQFTPLISCTFSVTITPLLFRSNEVSDELKIRLYYFNYKFIKSYIFTKYTILCTAIEYIFMSFSSSTRSR